MRTFHFTLAVLTWEVSSLIRGHWCSAFRGWHFVQETDSASGTLLIL